jgi:hypothetical protein
MPQETQLVAQFEKNSKEEVRVSIDDFHGRKLINLRVFYRTDNGEWLPGKQGIALGIDRYRDLADALVKLGEELQTRGLLQGKTPAISAGARNTG